MKFEIGPDRLVLSSLLFLLVIIEDLSVAPRFAYVAVFSLLPMMYGLIRKNHGALLFVPIILAFAYVPACLSYPLSVLSLLKLSIIWPLFFVLLAILTFPGSKEIEKRAIMTWFMASGISAFSVIGIFTMISPVIDPFVVAVLGVIAGLAMLYISYK